MDFLSLGCGVQSSTMLLMALRGVLPRPDAAIFADTGCEPDWVYRYLDFLKSQCDTENLPLHVVSVGNIMEDIQEELGSDLLFSGQPPFFVRRQENMSRDAKMLFRKCTVEYKIKPIQAKIQELVGGRVPGQVSWIGISLDEKRRAKPSSLKWISNRYPLLEHGFSRMGCINWLAQNSLPIPRKSSCIICPFHTRDYWADLAQTEPHNMARAIEFDDALRERGFPNIRGKVFVHRGCTPLRNLLNDIETSESNPTTQIALPIWGNAQSECENACFL